MREHPWVRIPPHPPPLRVKQQIAWMLGLQAVHLTFYSCYSWRGGTDHGTIIISVATTDTGRRDEAGAGPVERVGVGQGARERRGGVPSAGAGSDELPIDRWLALETANAGKVIEITSEQAAFLEKLNPCFRERHVESSSPGELLSADTFFVGSLKGVGKVYLHAVIDTFGSYAFGFLHVSRQPEAAVAVLHNDVLPFLPQPRPAHRRDPHRQRPRVLRDRAPPLRALPRAGRHLGYRNMGRRPIETVMSFVSQEG